MKSNEPLNDDEKLLMKLQYVLDRKVAPVDEKALNFYIRGKF